MLLFRTFSAPFKIFFVTRGDALRACPWLSYCAPSALAPGSHIPRLRRWRELFVAKRDERIHLRSFSRREETGQQRNHPEDHRNDHEDGDVERAHSEQQT